MSFSYTGSACNMTTYYPLTNSSVNSTGTIYLSNLDPPSSGCVTRFWATGLNQGATTYQFDNYIVSLNGASNMIYANYGGASLGSNAYTFVSTSNQITIKYAPTQSNTTLACYVGSTMALSTVSSNVALSNPTHSWTGLNSTALSKTITTPLVQNVISFYNNVNIQDSLRVANNATIIGNLTVNGTTNFASTSSSNQVASNLTVTGTTNLATMTASNITTSTLSGLITIATSGGATLGGAQFGDFGYGSTGYAGFNHNAQPYSGSTYAFLCDNVGNTYLNAANSNHILSFRQGNAEQVRLDANGVFMTSILSNQGAMTTATLSNQGAMTTASLSNAGNSTCANLLIPSTGTIQLGAYVVGKEGNAGKIAYQGFSTCLDVVGAGTATPRTVRLYDSVGIGANPNTSYALDITGNSRFQGSARCQAHATLASPTT